MKKIIKKIKMLSYILLIILAIFGINMAGGIPVLPTKKEDSNEIKIELVETNHLHSPSTEAEIKP